ncbi:MAG: hypothetical protein V1809_15480 [Planctomycetota bacterium]
MPNRPAPRAALLLLALALSAAPPENGPHTETWPNGKKKLEARYKDGKPDGDHTEYFESGAKKLHARYRKGVLHGSYVEYADDGKTVRNEVWRDGILAYPRPLADIQRTIALLKPQTMTRGPMFIVAPSPKSPIAAGTLAPAALQAALAQLKIYRYLAGVPWEDITPNNRYNQEAQHGAVLLAILGRLNHTPPKPDGVSEEFYKTAHAGTSHGNLAQGMGSLVTAITGWMNDSDPGNIAALGHRRWCLNPPMKETGFGNCGDFNIIWAHDAARKETPDYDFIPFPVRGYHPVAYFQSDWAWHVSLNPKKYQKPDKNKARAKIFPLDPAGNKARDPLPLNYESVNNTGYGIPACVIFRPDTIRVSPGARYTVELEGIQDAAGADTRVEYFVEFCK